MQTFESILHIVEVSVRATRVYVGRDDISAQHSLGPAGLVGRVRIEVRYVGKRLALEAASFPVAPSVIVEVRVGFVEMEQIGALDVQHDESWLAAAGPVLGLLLDRRQDEHGV